MYFSLWKQLQDCAYPTLPEYRMNPHAEWRNYTTVITSYSWLLIYKDHDSRNASTWEKDYQTKRPIILVFFCISSPPYTTSPASPLLHGCTCHNPVGSIPTHSHLSLKKTLPCFCMSSNHNHNHHTQTEITPGLHQCKIIKNRPTLSYSNTPSAFRTSLCYI